MNCERPIMIKNKKTKGGILAPCGTCRSCKITNVQEWSFRLKQELHNAKNGIFLTLTYAENRTELEPSDLRHFLKRLRNFVDYRYQMVTDGKIIATIAPQRDNLRFFAVGEYGEKTLRPHYHILLFNIPVFKDRNSTLSEREIMYNMFLEIWGKGLIHIGSIEDSSINYVCKYIFKRSNFPDGDYERPFRMMSKNPAIGHSYIERKGDFHTVNRSYTYDKDKKIRLPRYYRDRVFTEEEKEEIKKKNFELLDKARAEEYSKPVKEVINNLARKITYNEQQNETFKIKSKL